MGVALIPAAIAIFLGSLIQTVMSGEVLEWSIPWIPSLGVEFSLLVDGLSLLFGLIISGVGALVILYASAYLAGKPLQRLFYVYIL